MKVIRSTPLVGLIIFAVTAMPVILAVALSESFFKLAINALIGFACGWTLAAAFDFANKRYVSSKYLFDRVAALIILILAAPIMVVIAILIKLTSPGPVLYRQERVGLNRRARGANEPGRLPGEDRRAANHHGRVFLIQKFRTMVVDAEADGTAVWAKEHDSRVTPIGRFLRGTHLDELPQLLNVLRGDMSLIGPRPERPHFVDQFADSLDEYTERLGVRPGVTGLAQVCQAADRKMEDVKRKIRYDICYVRDASLVLDTKIFLFTLLKILTGRLAEFPIPAMADATCSPDPVAERSGTVHDESSDPENGERSPTVSDGQPSSELKLSQRGQRDISTASSSR